MDIKQLIGALICTARIGYDPVVAAFPKETPRDCARIVEAVEALTRTQKDVIQRLLDSDDFETALNLLIDTLADKVCSPSCP